MITYTNKITNVILSSQKHKYFNVRFTWFKYFEFKRVNVSQHKCFKQLIHINLNKRQYTNDNTLLYIKCQYKYFNVHIIEF